VGLDAGDAVGLDFIEPLIHIRVQILPHAPELQAQALGGKSRSLSRTTTIKKWDPTNLSTNATPQDNFVQIKITIDNQTLTFYVCNLN